MAPPLSRTAFRELNHWWSELRFRLRNRKGWNQMIDETFMLQNQRVNDIPLFVAAKENDVGSIKKLLKCPSTDIFERGALGETVLHVAAMNDNLEAALALVEGVPELIDEPMTADLFQGLSALHIAVMNQNVSLVHKLISKGANVATPRVTGMYFRKRRGGQLYYGEHILSFAACVGNEEIISMLINAGANIRAQDTFENKSTACKTIDLLMAKDGENSRDIPLDVLPNYRGITPLKLAAKEGNSVVFQHLVHSRRITQWSSGPLNSRLYDLTEIDSWADSSSVLEQIVGSQEKEARKILELTPVKQLVSLKWNLYGKHYFRVLLVLYHLYIGIFTLCCVNRPLKDIPENYTKSSADKTIYIQKSFKESYVTYGDHLRLVGEMISVLGAFIILLLEIPDILRVGAKRYFGQTALGGPFHVILISFAFLVILLCILRVSGIPGETVVMAICLVFAWCNVMYFARGFQVLGPYVIMIQKILCGDILSFMWLIIITQIAFSSALWMVYMTQDPNALPSFRSFPITLFSEFEVSVGIVDLPVDNSILNPPIVYVLHCIFGVVSCLLIFNLLIAMMSDIQWRVAQEKNELWKIQVVATTLMLERRLPRFLWPRIGVCGAEYGLGDRWYLRMEDRDDKPSPRIRHCIDLLMKDTANKAESAAPSNPPAIPSLDTNPKAKSTGLQRGWEVIRAYSLALKEEKEANKPKDEPGAS